MTNPLILELRYVDKTPVVDTAIQIEIGDGTVPVRLEARTDQNGPATFEATIGKSCGGLRIFVLGKEFGPYRHRGRPYQVSAVKSNWCLEIRTIGESSDQAPAFDVDVSERSDENHDPDTRLSKARSHSPAADAEQHVKHGLLDGVVKPRRRPFEPDQSPAISFAFLQPAW